jgi:hypothetical protein
VIFQASLRDAVPFCDLSRRWKRRSTISCPSGTNGYAQAMWRF